MQLPQRSKRLEWNFNTIVTLIGIVCGLVVTAVGWGVTYADMRNDNRDLREQIDSINARFVQESGDRKDRLKTFTETIDGLKTNVAQIQPIQIQQSQMLEKITENKTGIAETNKRIDRVVESFGGKLDTLIDNINKVATRVEVLGSKLDDAQGRTNKTMWRTPIVRP